MAPVNVKPPEGLTVEPTVFVWPTCTKFGNPRLAPSETLQLVDTQGQLVNGSATMSLCKDSVSLRKSPGLPSNLVTFIHSRLFLKVASQIQRFHQTNHGQGHIQRTLQPFQFLFFGLVVPFIGAFQHVFLRVWIKVIWVCLLMGFLFSSFFFFAGGCVKRDHKESDQP